MGHIKSKADRDRVRTLAAQRKKVAEMLNRQQRRKAARSLIEFYQRIARRPDDLKMLQLIEDQAMQDTQRRMLALTYAVLRREFGFGNVRLRRFVSRMLQISEETGGGEKLIEMGLTFDEIYREVMQERDVEKQKDKPSEPGDVPRDSAAAEQCQI